MYTAYSETLDIRTSMEFEVQDVTDLVAQVIGRSGVVTGSVLVFSQHTTFAVIINEAERLYFEDLQRLLEAVAALVGDCRHDDIEARGLGPDEPKNGKGHLICTLLGPSETIPVADGKMCLGQWQQVLLVETSGPRDRKVVVQVSGEKGDVR